MHRRIVRQHEKTRQQQHNAEEKKHEYMQEGEMLEKNRHKVKKWHEKQY